MKLARFEADGRTAVGVVIDNGIAEVAGQAPDIPAMLRSQAALRDVADAAAAGPHRPLGDVRLLAPIPRPGKFLCVGLNYLDHIEETGAKRPERPTIFNKQITCVIGPGDPILKPAVSSEMDYEGEFGIVIGRRCRHVPKERAREVIGGYVVVNDVSTRDWQRHSPTWTMGKSFDTHGPTGPWVVTADEIGDPHRLDIRTWVNGELRQSSNTRQLLFTCDDLIAYLSTVCTLEPGDVIATGTPGGVGFKMQPSAYLAAGDTVRIEIEGIGVLENPVADEPPARAFIEE